jgi:hypothetical protein
MATEQPTITISFDDQQQYEQMRDAVALADGYTETVSDAETGEQQPNPQSKDDFMLTRIAGFLASKKQAVANADYAANMPPIDYGFASGTTPAGPVGKEPLP